MWDSLLFVSCLLGCLMISCHYRGLKNNDEKKLFGAGFGFLITFMICGEYIVHPMFITLINILLIIQGDKKFVHMKSLTISFLYLVLMHVGIIQASQSTIDIQMIITLRLVGLCYELNTSYLVKNRTTINMDSELFLNQQILEKLRDIEKLDLEPQLTDVLAYSFNFVGLLRGPYYTWKTFKEYFELPFNNYEVISTKISRKIDNIPVTYVMYVWLNIFYPLNQYFYEYSVFDVSTLWCCYNIPRLVIIYLHYYMITSICEAICIEAGLGVYPTSCQSDPGVGPTRRFELIQQMIKDRMLPSNEKYNYNTVKIFGEYMIFTSPTMTKSLKYCDMTIQYWFWANIYRRIPFQHKYLRLVVTTSIWCLWNGLNVSNFILVSTLLLYIYVEDTFTDLIGTTNFSIYKNSFYIGTSLISKIMCFIYIVPLLYKMDAKDVIRYFNSARWSFHIVLLLFLFCSSLLKRRMNKLII